MDIRKTGQIKDGEVVVGTKTRVKVVKNKVAPPFRECEFEIMYEAGVNAAAELVALGSAANVIEKSGAFYSYRGERIAQGRDKAAAYFGENPKIAAESARGWWKRGGRSWRGLPWRRRYKPQQRNRPIASHERRRVGDRPAAPTPACRASETGSFRLLFRSRAEALAFQHRLRFVAA